MKKNYLSVVAALLGSLGMPAQSFELWNTTSSPSLQVANGATVFNTTMPVSSTKNEFMMKNASTTTQTVTIKKSLVYINTVSPGDAAQAYFCTGVNCYAASVMAKSVVLAPGENMSFTADLDEASVAGNSEVVYSFTAVNPGATVTLVITIKYSASPAGLHLPSEVLSGISLVFPNPSSGAAFLSVQAKRELNNLQLQLINALGARVYLKEINVPAGRSTIDLDTEALAAGVYFVQLRSGPAVATRKLTVVK